MPEVKLTQLTKRFGAVAAVQSVDLVIADGEFVFLLGPSGCGKTTTLRMIAGLEMPSEGRIEIDGRNVTYLRGRYRNVGMVFQDYGLYRHMNVFENIAYPLRVRKFGKEQIAAKVNEVAQRLVISDVLRRMPDQLAGGQLQRVAIARMLVRDADVFLMDEPMSHLDARLRAHMRAELKHIQKSIGVTTVFVTHDQLEAMTMADRIVVIRNGVIQQAGTPQEIFETPTNEFVATFVGEPQMNVLDCSVAVEGGACTARGGGFSAQLDAGWFQRSRAAHAPSLRLGIRPEHVAISGTRRDGFEVPARLFAFEATGAENLFTVRCGDAFVTARAPTAETLGIDRTDDAPVHLRFDPSWVYLFDGKSGETLAQAAASGSAGEGGR